MKISLLFAFFSLLSGTRAALNYYGKYIGPLKSYHHGLGGDVYVVDSRTLHIRNFAYDGEGPAGYFYVSNTKTPNENGIKLRDERGGLNPLKRYRKQHVTLTLPEGKSVSNIKWFYVWCDEFSVNFGDIRIPKNLDFPKPQKIGKLNGVHAVSSDNVVVVDAQTLLIPSFSYDGEAPDAKFWVGSGLKPTPQGVRVPDENGKEEPLRRYDKKTIVLTLPADLTVFDIGHFGIWCEAFTVDFGHIQIPKDLNIPPSLKMLGVSPQKSTRSIIYQAQRDQKGGTNSNQLPAEYPTKNFTLFKNHVVSSNNNSNDKNNDNSNSSSVSNNNNDDSNINNNKSVNVNNLSGQGKNRFLSPTTYKPTFNFQRISKHNSTGVESAAKHVEKVKAVASDFAISPPNSSFGSKNVNPINRSEDAVQILRAVSYEGPHYTGNDHKQNNYFASNTYYQAPYTNSDNFHNINDNRHLLQSGNSENCNRNSAQLISRNNNFNGIGNQYRNDATNSRVNPNLPGRFQSPVSASFFSNKPADPISASSAFPFN